MGNICCIEVDHNDDNNKVKIEPDKVAPEIEEDLFFER